MVSYTDIGAVIVGILIVMVGVYMLYRYLRRRGPELAAREGKTVLDDRSYNQVRIGQAAADRLAQTGIDVSVAKQLFRRAESARAAGNYNLSLELSKKGQDSLATARSGGMTLPSSSPSRPGAPVDPAPSISPSAGPLSAAGAPYSPPTMASFGSGGANGPVAGLDSGAALEPGPSRPPKNKMEARFQISLVQDELDQARESEGRTKSFRDAEGLKAQGQAAYDRQEFTEALRLALKSRRTLGTRVEGLPVSPSPVSSPGPGDLTASAAASRASGSNADSPTFGQKCAKCGRTAAPGDQYCRGCGAPVAPAFCSSCGAPLLAGDRLCGKCGAMQS
jgi:Double zinc ribbon